MIELLKTWDPWFVVLTCLIFGITLIVVTGMITICVFSLFDREATYKERLHGVHPTRSRPTKPTDITYWH